MLKKSYYDFMSDYSSAGHMSEISSKNDKKLRVFIPHHPVLREESSTTKLRVVFNASSINASKKSLNDFLNQFKLKVIKTFFDKPKRQEKGTSIILIIKV